VRNVIGTKGQIRVDPAYEYAGILNDRKPEPSVEDGMQDVRIVQALYQSNEK